MIEMLFQGLLVVLSVVSLASRTHAAAAKEGFLRTVVDKAEEGGLYWDYNDGPFGPAHWGELSPSWKLCSAGRSQSPIDIDTGKLKYDKELDIPAVHDYQDTEAYAVNTGHSVQVIWPAGTLSVEGKNYTLTHVEFHTPSEHTINGESLPLETQIVHVNEDGDYAIVVVFSDYGPTNWWVEEFWHLIPTLDNIGKRNPVGLISPDGFGVDFSKYYRYEGSLTSPDCRENVVYTILSTVRTIDINLFLDFYHRDLITGPGKICIAKYRSKGRAVVKHGSEILQSGTHAVKISRQVYEISEEQIAHLLTLLPSSNNRPVQSLGNRNVYIPQSA